MTERILILDFGSQFTQLIARCIREANVFCEIIPYNKSFTIDEKLKGVILSGSPFSVNDSNFLDFDVDALHQKVPILSICYGAQLTVKKFGGVVNKSNKREYGRAFIEIEQQDILFKNIETNSQVWMSHSDSIVQLPQGFDVLASTNDIPVAAFKKINRKSCHIWITISSRIVSFNRWQKNVVEFLN